ncbi:glycosyltransferase [Isoptericola hypogeus]
MEQHAGIEEMFPEEVFDRAFYLADNPDVKAAGVDPWVHFTTYGHREGRIWSAAARPVAPALRAWAARLPGDARTPVLDLLRLVPAEHRSSLLSDAGAWQTLHQMVHPTIYRMQELVAAGALEPGDPDPEADPGSETIDAGAAVLAAGRDESVDDVLADFLVDGVHRGLRPSALFHPEWYTEAALRELGSGPDGHPLFHWLAVGYPARVSPTPLFDEDFYRRTHGDMANVKGWAFDHFVNHGCYETFRVPSTVLNQRLGHGRHSRPHRIPIVADMILAEERLEDIARTSALEERAMLAQRLRSRLDDPVMRELVERAYEIEPMIRRPYTARRVSLAPVLSHASDLFERAEALRRSLPVSRVDNVVVVPHVRMAGSARVAGAFVRTLHDLDTTGRTLVLTTDLNEFQRPDWFPEDVLLVDIAEVARELPEEARVRLLLDVVRGLQPRRVMNINSGLGWVLYTTFGRQLSAIMDLHAYLFTWELDKHGNKGGYPVRAIQECLSSLTSVIVDSKPLHDELTWRYGHSSRLADVFRLVYTPAEYLEHIDHSQVLASRRQEGRVLRAFWAGRFDRQKRFDVVVDVATMLPDLEIWVWGRRVLGGSDIDFADLPPNIKLQGTYQQFDDLPVESCDFFLYTAEWDGVPTILIDAAARGVTTVASAVGGVADLVTEETGYPVTDALDPAAYVAAIEEMVASPVEAARRSGLLRKHARSLCSRETFARAMSVALRLEGEPTALTQETPR